MSQSGLRQHDPIALEVSVQHIDEYRIEHVSARDAPANVHTMNGTAYGWILRVRRLQRNLGDILDHVIDEGPYLWR